jgi:hypothetical protein
VASKPKALVISPAQFPQPGKQLAETAKKTKKGAEWKAAAAPVEVEEQ